MDSGMSYCDEKLAINYHKLVKLVLKKWIQFQAANTW